MEELYSHVKKDLLLPGIFFNGFLKDRAPRDFIFFCKISKFFADYVILQTFTTQEH
jgi:hypothetical protein